MNQSMMNQSANQSWSSQSTIHLRKKVNQRWINQSPATTAAPASTSAKAATTPPTTPSTSASEFQISNFSLFVIFFYPSFDMAIHILPAPIDRNHCDEDEDAEDPEQPHCKLWNKDKYQFYIHVGVGGSIGWDVEYLLHLVSSDLKRPTHKLVNGKYWVPRSLHNFARFLSLTWTVQPSLS